MLLSLSSMAAASYSFQKRIFPIISDSSLSVNRNTLPGKFPLPTARRVLYNAREKYRFPAPGQTVRRGNHNKRNKIMEYHLNQAIIHLLDSGASAPLLSEQPLVLDDENSDYLLGHIIKLHTGDDCKNCTFLPGSPFEEMLIREKEFVPMSQSAAQMFFEQMMRYPEIPSGDLAVADLTIDGKPFLAILKMNYRTAYLHDAGHPGLVSLVRQKTILPSSTSKCDEAILIQLDTGAVKLVEKRVEMDGGRDFYISTKLLNTSPAKTEKVKLQAVRDAALHAVKEAYDDDGKVETAVANIIRAETSEDILPVQQVKARLERDFPEAASAFEEELIADDIRMEEQITVPPARIKKITSRTVKSHSGIEVKIPGDVFLSDETVEFINNPDGSLSLLVKNVIL